MNVFKSLAVSATGLSAQRTRMNFISSNLANVHTTRTPDGGPYVRKDVIFAAQASSNSFHKQLLSEINGQEAPEVRVVGVINDPRPPLMKYEPGHPDADEKGYVAMPNINALEEMVNMMAATRSYEANVTAIQAAKSMILKALEIGR
jgi:flagellar basal-body rod protein FlgC